MHAGGGRETIIQFVVALMTFRLHLASAAGRRAVLRL